MNCNSAHHSDFGVRGAWLPQNKHGQVVWDDSPRYARMGQYDLEECALHHRDPRCRTAALVEQACRDIRRQNV